MGEADPVGVMCRAGWDVWQRPPNPSRKAGGPVERGSWCGAGKARALSVVWWVPPSVQGVLLPLGGGQ